MPGTPWDRCCGSPGGAPPTRTRWPRSTSGRVADEDPAGGADPGVAPPGVDVSVVVPAYNERDRLPPTLRAIDEYLGERSGRTELIVVDDGSADGTAEAVEG